MPPPIDRMKIFPRLDEVLPGKLCKVCGQGCFAYPGDMLIAGLESNSAPVPMPDKHIPAGEIIFLIEKQLKGMLYLVIHEDRKYTLVNVGLELEPLTIGEVV